MTKTFENGSRIADITETRDGEFQAFIGYKECKSIHMSGMQVVDRKTYKRISSAEKFCTKWVNG